jgi:hypothetical protein
MDKQHWLTGAVIVAMLLFTANPGRMALARGVRGGGRFGAGTFAGHGGMSRGFGGYQSGINAGSSGWRSSVQATPWEGHHVEGARDFNTSARLSGPAFHSAVTGDRGPRRSPAGHNYYPESGPWRGPGEAHRGYGEREGPHARIGFTFGYPYWGYYGYGWPYAYGYAYPENYYDYYPYEYPEGGYVYPGNTYEYAYPETYPNTPVVTENPAAADGATFYAQAQDAFRRADYREALRLSAHAAVEMPKDPHVHQLMSLAMFALGDYRGAAIEAHAALALGPAPDWATTYRLYGGASKDYTSQLRALEAFVREHSGEADGHFLLGYEYLMLGHREAAKHQFTTSATQAPKDGLARHMVEQLGSTAPASTPQKPNTAH